MSEQQPEDALAEAPPPGAEQECVFFVSLQYRGSAYDVPVQAEDPVASIFDFAQEALDFPRENCKLISRGKMLRPDADNISVGEAGLKAGSKLMLVASSAHDVSFVQSSRPDPLVKGFAEEERDERSRRKRARAAAQSAWGTKQDAEYKFSSIKAEFKYSEPPPYEAERLLQKLATDPGIIDIMKARQFKVGILTEMSPTEAQERMAKRGTPNMDLLGYNQNSGEMIVLRLRTDNLKGFRPYHDLINTLVHELTHNVWGPHDHNFWKLYGELKAQYMRFHRFWSHGGNAADSNATAQFQGFVDGDEQQTPTGAGFGHVLGSVTEGDDTGDAQARAAAAAEARFKQASEAAAASAGVPFEPGSGAAGLPNFLAGDGSWTVVCPCGQVHTFEGMCDVGAAAAAAGTAAAPAEGVADGTAALPAAAAQPEPADLPPQESATSMLTEAPAALEEPAAPERDEAAAGAGDQRAPCEAQAEAPLLPAPAGEVAPEAPGGQVGQSADIEEQRVGPSPELDLGELAAHGLDGAALWLRRFEERLRALLGTPPGRPEAREAVALLLRLVRNVVDSPYEQKFRRIRADNPRVRATLLGAGAEAEALMTLLGFEAVTESGERVFLLRDAVFDCARLRMGQELLERELHAEATSVQ